MTAVSAPALAWVFMAGPRPAVARQLDTERLPDHADRLFRAALMYTGSRHDAEDLVQETYERVLRRRRFVRAETDVAYLMRTLRNTWLSGRKRRDTEELTEMVDPRAPDPLAQVEVRELLDAVAELPDGYRDAVIAVDVAGLSYREAAKALRTREGTIMSRLFRGRRQVVEKVG
jgi:RNA polymerase sigma-70 factor (ECF subfamily)